MLLTAIRLFLLISFFTIINGCIKTNKAYLKSGATHAHEFRYKVINSWPDSQGKYGFQVEVMVYPQLENGWKMEFDYPYQIANLWEAKILEGKGPGKYVIGDPNTGMNLFQKITSKLFLASRVNTSYRVYSAWGNEFQAEILFSENVRDWIIEFDYDYDIKQLWAGRILSKNGNRFRIAGSSYQTDRFGFIGIGGNGANAPRNITLSFNSGGDSEPTPTSQPTPTAQPTPNPTVVPPTQTPTPTVQPTQTPTPTVQPTPTSEPTPPPTTDIDYSSFTKFGFIAYGKDPGQTSFTNVQYIESDGGSVPPDGGSGSGGDGTPPTPPPTQVSDPNDDWLHVKGNMIVDMNENPVWLTGTNWFGYNTGTNTFDGLWNTNLEKTIQAMALRGINILRIPMSVELVKAWKSGQYPKANVNEAENGNLVGKNSLEVFDIAI
ncbi:MAG: hypothetical protein HQK54_13390, partial [Oligoflexales bacterium]|nr:hypothetical protein [Oligoflexales bacterium]